jgi:carboxymethylenebutenolidase
MARHVGAVSDEHTLADLDVVLEWLRAEGVDDRRVGLVGFCFGGRVAFLVATRRSIGAAVGFYGGGIVHARSEGRPSLLPGVLAMQTPWLGLFGADDESIPADDVDAIEAAVASAPVSTEAHVYANAGHAFLNDTRPDRHVPEVADEAWSRTLTWFDEHLAGD